MGFDPLSIVMPQQLDAYRSVSNIDSDPLCPTPVLAKWTRFAYALCQLNPLSPWPASIGFRLSLFFQLHLLRLRGPLYMLPPIFIPLVIEMFRKKDGGISVVAKKRSAIGTFF
jgi:hypothetical protein